MSLVNSPIYPPLGNLATYRHYLTIGSTRTEVFPLNFLASSLTDELEKDKVFYRRKFNGSLTFVNTNGDDDFDLINMVELSGLCTKVIYEIERDGVDYWNGYFSTSDGKFDYDKCTFEVTPLPDDDYAYLLDKADLQYNMLNMDDPATGIPYPSVTTTAYVLGYVDPAKVYTRNRWLTDIIEFLCDFVIPGATYSSDFFTLATNPATLNPNKLLYLTIAQKSDIVRPTASNEARTALISFNELMDILWVMWQVQWRYDPVANNFIIEHCSYWSASPGMNLSIQEMARNNKYVYQKEAMPKYEKFTFMEADDANFVGVPIWYNSKCVNSDPESNVIEKNVTVTTDLEYIINQPDAIADEGFVILCNYLDGGSYYVEFGQGVYNSKSGLNMHLSWANLHNSYYRHNRVLINGYLNDLPVTFWTAQKNKVQECYAIVCPDDDYNPGDEITTELGDVYFGGEKAKVQRSELSPSGEMKFSLLYGPNDNVNTGVSEGKTIFIKQTADDTFKATLTQPAPVGNITLALYVIIHDSMGAEVCNGSASPQTWTIEAGNRVDTVTLVAPAMCDVIPAGGCMELMLNSTGAPGWFIDFRHDYTNYCS